MEKKQWLVHSYQNPPKVMTCAQAKRLMAKRGGSHTWLDNVCHVYLLPKVDITFNQHGQDELSPLFSVK